MSDLAVMDRATLTVMDNVCVLCEKSVSYFTDTEDRLDFKKNVWRCRKSQATLITLIRKDEMHGIKAPLIKAQTFHSRCETLMVYSAFAASAGRCADSPTGGCEEEVAVSHRKGFGADGCLGLQAWWQSFLPTSPPFFFFSVHVCVCVCASPWHHAAPPWRAADGRSPTHQHRHHVGACPWCRRKQIRSRL